MDTFVAVVDWPGRPHPVLSLRDSTLWLEATEYTSQLPAAVITLKGTTLQGGEPMKAVLLSGLTLPPACHLEAKVLGLVEDNGGQLPPIAVAVPAADTMMSSVSRIDDVPTSYKQALDETLAILGYRDWNFVPPETAIEIIQGHRRSKRATPSISQVPSHNPGAANRALLSRLPWRFQEYLSGLLLPDERILALALRNAFETESGRVFRSRQRHLEGICAVTDRGILFLEDVLVPDLTMVQWGYHATTAALERVAGCQVEEERGILWLRVLLQGTAGQHEWKIPFPRGHLGDLESLAPFLRTVAASTVKGQALQRKPDLVQDLAPSQLATLHSLRLQPLLSEPLLQLAITQHRLASRFVAATPSRLALLAEVNGQIHIERLIPYQAIILAGLRRSVTGYWLECTVIGGDSADILRVSFASEEFDGFLGVFQALRRGMALVSREVAEVHHKGE